MMPAGNSIGLTLEDAILLTRLLDNTKPNNPQDAFPRYEEIRRPRIEKDYKHAVQRWSGVKTISWWRQRLREFFFWLYLAFFARHVDESFKYDVFKQEL
jgi:salicylate hydroxylase